MSRFYEVRQRDGAARIGRLQLNEVVQTPLMLRVESLTYWESKEGRGEVPRGAVGAVLLPEVHPFFEAGNSQSGDFFVLAFASALLNSPRDFARRIVGARERIPPDAALWVPGVATAENAAVLFYAGVDLVDNTNAVLKGYGGIYQTEEGEVRLESLKGESLEELPCNCSVCSSLSAGELRKKAGRKRALLLARHNTLLLEKEVKKVRARVRAGTLREYVEQKVRSSVFLTAVLRILDSEAEEYFERRTPVARRGVQLKANTMESLKRVEVRRFARRVQERYEPPAGRRVLVLLPCSARKPYSASQSHRKFVEAVADFRGCLHELILTSPLGVVPRELELAYPAAFYDIPVTGYWDAEERAWVASCLRAYLERNLQNYESAVVVAHLGGAAREICSGVAAELGVEIVQTCEGERGEEATTAVCSKEGLSRLKEVVAELCGEKQRLTGFELKAGVVKALADFQFGLGAGSGLVGNLSFKKNLPKKKEGERMKITGKFPFYKLSSKGEVLARIVPEFGTLALTVKGARRIANFLSPRSSYKVEIGDFVPKGSVLAPGVVNADPEIRENDEVVFVGAKAFGVGRAKMSGWEMVESRRGVAVQVREVKKV